MFFSFGYVGQLKLLELWEGSVEDLRELHVDIADVKDAK